MDFSSQLLFVSIPLGCYVDQLIFSLQATKGGIAHPSLSDITHKVSNSNVELGWLKQIFKHFARFLHCTQVPGTSCLGTLSFVKDVVFFVKYGNWKPSFKQKPACEPKSKENKQVEPKDA